METEFDKIEREVKNEVQKRLTKIKQKNENDVRANTLLLKVVTYLKLYRQPPTFLLDVKMFS